jgi:hypothetical protein
MDLLHDAQTQGVPWNVMEDREGSDQVKNLMDRCKHSFVPIRGGQVGTDKRSRGIFPPVPGNFEQGQAKIQSRIGTALTASHPFTCQFPVPAAQIKERFITGKSVQNPLHSRLETLARGRELPPEGLVELLVQQKQPRTGLGFHKSDYICVW